MFKTFCVAFILLCSLLSGCVIETVEMPTTVSVGQTFEAEVHVMGSDEAGPEDGLTILLCIQVPNQVEVLGVSYQGISSIDGEIKGDGVGSKTLSQHYARDLDARHSGFCFATAEIAHYEATDKGTATVRFRALGEVSDQIVFHGGYINDLEEYNLRHSTQKKGLNVVKDYQNRTH